MIESAAHLLSLAYPSEFIPGARSAVTTCLRIDPAEKVTLITDRVTEPIAAAIAAQLAELGCPWNAFILEDLAPRPLGDMPAAVLADMDYPVDYQRALARLGQANPPEDLPD